MAVPWAATVCLLYTKSDKWSHSITAPKTRIRQPIGYGRFARAADAIRFAMEELPPELLLAAQLKVADKRFDGDGIRRLYESIEYPLARRAVSR